MVAGESRYDTAARLDYTTPAGDPVVYYAPRILPQPEDHQPVVIHRVTDSDRVDLLAWKNLGNPLLSWRIADANRSMDPWTLASEPGATLAIPVAGGAAA